MRRSFNLGYVLGQLFPLIALLGLVLAMRSVISAPPELRADAHVKRWNLEGLSSKPASETLVAATR